MAEYITLVTEMLDLLLFGHLLQVDHLECVLVVRCRQGKNGAYVSPTVIVSVLVVE